MNREYLENYQQREREQLERLVENIKEDRFSLERDRFPSDDKFKGIQKPVALASHWSKMQRGNLWAEIPFCGSLIITIPAIPKDIFEALFFDISELSNVIDFIKTTGRLQISLGDALNLKLLKRRAEMLDAVGTGLHPSAVLGQSAEKYGVSERCLWSYWERQKKWVFYQYPCSRLESTLVPLGYSTSTPDAC